MAEPVSCCSKTITAGTGIMAEAITTTEFSYAYIQCAGVLRQCKRRSHLGGIPAG